MSDEPDRDEMAGDLDVEAPRGGAGASESTEAVDGARVEPSPGRGRTFGPPALVLVALLAGCVGAVVAGGGVYVATRSGAAPPVAAEAAEVQYQCPMHPSIVQDHPGTCPICGMNLVKMEGVAAGGQAEGASGAEGLATVQIDSDRQQLIGLRTAEVTRGPIGGAWRTVGRVAVDETRVRHANVKVGGFVETVFVDYIGKAVRKGQPLFSIYSPELYAAQQEYLLALQTRRRLSEAGGLAQNGEDLVASARRRLQLWDIPDSELDRLEQTGEATKSLTLYSPISGVVVKKDVVDGMRLEPGAMPYEIVDLSTVWVLADVYESELRFIEEGMEATLALKAFPDRAFRGRVAFVEPLLDPTTRTVKVRLAFPNPSGDLRPEMFGEVTLLGPLREAVRVPSDALVESGSQTVVFVALGDGKFSPREIRVGARDGDLVEVVEGLAEGERVVSRANFLVDSESRLKASLAALAAEKVEGAPTEGPASDPHAGHGGR